MTKLLELSLTDLCRTLTDREASPVDLMKEVFERIDGVNDRVTALVSFADRDKLLADARAAEQRIAEGRGRPLEGIPLGVKDLEDVEGMITSYGSVPFKDTLATRDSTQVARLRAAGALVVGKTNTPEFGSAAFTRNLLFGESRNPWSLEHSPGGSSGGSSAALVAGILPLVTGSDGGGSVRIPACLVGAFGLKPSYGRIPNGPRDRWHWIDTEHHGPITRTVADGAFFLDQVCGPSEWDETSLPAPGYSYVQKLQEGLPDGLRIAYSPDLGEAVVQREVAEAVGSGVDVFRSLGHQVNDLEGGPPRVTAGWVYLNSLDEYAHFKPMLAEHEGGFGRGFIAAAKAVANDTPDRLELMIRRRAELIAWTAQLFEQHDLLLTPTVAYDGHPARGPYPTEIDGKPAHATGPAAFTVPFNLTGHPAATVRVGISSNGLPMGMQIVGPRHRDDLVLQAAAAFERERPWHPNWPQL